MSKFAFRGHPFHPMLVPLAIGLVIWTLVCDLVYVLSGREAMWYDFAFWTGAGAIGGGLVAALPGFGDYLTMGMGNRTRRIATLHMILNLGVVAMFLAAMLLMLDDGATGGTDLVIVIVLHAAATGLLAISGWLGGEMVYVHQLAVQEAPGREREERPVEASGRSPQLR